MFKHDLIMALRSQIFEYLLEKKYRYALGGTWDRLVFYSFRNAYMLCMLPLYCRIDLEVEHCCWHSNARATTQL